MTVFRAAAATAALLMTTAIPAIAQQAGRDTPTTQMPDAGSPTPTQSQLSDAMVRKVGTALRHVVTIRQQYAQREQSEKSPEQQQKLTDQAQKDMVKAIGEQGLSVDQYSQAIQMAQADPALRQRLVSVAQSGD
jgi:Tat protein secretion system quality control protein TatD with DNase activity